MPIHDWARVDAGVFHDFHHAWIEEIRRALNGGILPSDYYAMAEQKAAGFGPDVLTLQESDVRPPSENSASHSPTGREQSSLGVVVAEPGLAVTAETDMAFYRGRKSVVTVRHVSGDRIVSIVEIVSPGNKNSAFAIRSFAEKAAELLERRIHLLVLDVLAAGPRDSQGMHGVIWEYFAGVEYELPRPTCRTFAAYETNGTVRAYVVAPGPGEPLPTMPLFLEPRQSVAVPLEPIYAAAFSVLPRRWKTVLEQ